MQCSENEGKYFMGSLFFGKLLLGFVQLMFW